MAAVDMPTKLGAEFLGTFLLIFTVGCNVLSGNAVWGGVSIGSVLMVAIYALGGISGANFNPAVSVALATTKALGFDGGLDVKTAGLYIGTQLLAGVAAALAYAAFFWETFNLAPAPGFGALHAGLCELLYTFVLCFVVLNTAVAKGNAGQFYGLAIGYVVVAGAYGAGAVSGGCFNPAVAVGIDVSSAGLGFGWCLHYVFMELLGAVLAAVAFKLVRPEEFGGEQGMAALCISEFLGTFVLVLTVGLNVLGKSPAGAYSIAASLMCMIYALGNVSGAHFNPAVTLAVLLSGGCAPDLTPARAQAYVAAQLAGAGAAGLMYSVIRRGESFPLAPGAGYGWTEVGIAEAIFTFVLCYVVLSVAVSKTTKADQMFGLAIGACVTVGGNAIGAISGGSLNPAVSFGIVLSDLVMAGGAFYPFLAYSAFELAGAGAAAGIYKVTHAVEEAGLKGLESKA